MKKIKLLIVDDSAVARKLLTEAVSLSKIIEVAGTALDPYIAADKIKKLNPDVLTLDLEMPRMDGLTFLSKLMIARPIPVIMVSSFTDANARETIRALELGAVDFILKPSFDAGILPREFSEELIEKIIAASQSKVRRLITPSNNRKTASEAFEKYTADVILPLKNGKNGMKIKHASQSVIAIGASTGGTEAIAEIFKGLSDDLPGILIAQHMPEKFTKAFADRINGIAKPYVKEAEEGDRVYRGAALIAPGNRHMILRSDADGLYVEINDGLPVNRHKPSVDVLFRSIAQIGGQSAVGILLTGMGADGAAGLLEMKEAGAETIAQDEESSVVFGMPREAIKIGAADRILSIHEIVSHLQKLQSPKVLTGKRDQD
ncbi:MAG: chemotaxis response regulator protein-glutamate methylesterase [Spirochaetes bacterium RBG_16_49_21]|nr:MAG: chemotaxis response regulator protein-glutamate methylesterase [Spirochaetes bacterium RBG_16_49_21]